MNDLLSLLTQQLLNPNVVQDLSKNLGTDDNKTSIAVNQFLPIITKALASNTAREEGASSLFSALANDHDGSILDQFGDLLNNPSGFAGNGILKHILGDKAGLVNQFLSNNSGIEPNKTAQLMQTLAPLIMGLLGKQTRQGGFDANSLMNFLQNTNQNIQTSDPKNSAMIERLLDKNNDGSVMDDVAKMGIDFLVKNWMSGRR